ncbi:MAG: YeeE/YedE family protein [Alphaproteobacteria bacterium]|nr:YeeE/YedE family protein [Alphaproteobacteria bacterium]
MDAYYLAAIGGALIGIAAVMTMGLTGRIAGISGIVGGLLPPTAGEDRGWRLAFIVGLIGGPVLVAIATGNSGIGVPAAGVPVLVLAGLCVGIGTTLGNGCTSGHGVCGMARLSRRSIVATATFTVVAIATVFVVRHLLAGA